MLRNFFRYVFAVAIISTSSVFDYSQTVNTNFYPASTGLSLGRQNQRWNGMFHNVNIDGTCVINGIPCFGTAGGSAGVAYRTTNYSLSVDDCNKTIAMNGTSLTVTLPSPPPILACAFFIENINSSALTISRNGLLIDSAASNLTLTQNQGVRISTDLVNYSTEREIGGGASAYSAITAGSNTAAKTEGTEGSLSPLGIGQVASNQLRLFEGTVKPTISMALTGGSFTTGFAVSVRYTFNSATGETLASNFTSASNNTIGCSSGSTCQLTITAPTIPTGFTGYSVYLQSCPGTPCNGSEALQAACTNITGNCVLNSATAGTAPPTVNTAWLQPPNVQTNPNCLPGTIPTGFFQQSNGNYQAWLGVDGATDTLSDGIVGTPVICYRTYFYDEGTQLAGQQGKNAFVAIDHKSGTGTLTNLQDRALFIAHSNPTADNATRWGLEGIQVELGVTGTPTFNGSPDGEVTAGTFTLGLAQTNDPTFGSLGANGIRVEAFRQGVGKPGIRFTGGQFIVVNSNTATSGNAVYTAVTGEVLGNGTDPAAASRALWAKVGTRSTLGSSGLFVDNFGTNASDYNIISGGLAGTPTNGKNFFQGNVILPNLFTAAKEINVTGSTVILGSNSTTQFATPGFGNGSVNVQGVSGATTWTYTITAVDGAGKESAASAPGTTTTGNATLTGSNFNRISMANTYTGGFIGGIGAGVGTYNIYRTAAGGTPSTTGKIGSITINDARNAGSAFTFDDTGLAGDGTTAPTVNDTGSVDAPLFKTATNCAASGTAANPSVVSCSAAPAGAVYCDVAASAGTCTINTTAVRASSRIFVTPSEADGTELSKTCNTAITFDNVPILSAKVAGTSFTINMPTVTTNGACFEYFIVN
jgi:hypothetical protein